MRETARMSFMRIILFIYVRKARIFLGLFLFVLLSSNLHAQSSGPLMSRQEFFGMLDYSIPDLVRVKNAVNAKDYTLAMHELANYYRNRTSVPWYFDPHDYSSDRPSFNKKTADNAAIGRVRIIGIYHTFSNNNFDWFYNATRSNNEWQWQLNRQEWWLQLGRGYWRTRDEKYARAFSKQLRSWIKQCPRPDNNGQGSPSAWRTIETGIRMTSTWAESFNRFLHSKYFTDEDILYFLISTVEQAQHLSKYPSSGNWIFHEMTGLYTMGCLFPEISQAEDWRSRAVQVTEDELDIQFLEDGAHFAYSPSYQMISIDYAYEIYKLAVLTKRKSELSPNYLNILEKGLDFMLKTTTPSGTFPSFQDCGTPDPMNKFFKEKYENFPNKPEFEWIATDGKSGTIPGYTSVLNNYSGFGIMRNDWTKTSNYLAFDGGGFGRGAHRHFDQLHMILFSNGEELLYDGGGGEYERSVWRNYALSTFSHNTINIDKKGQYISSNVYNEPTSPVDFTWQSSSDYDYVASSYSGDYGGSNSKIATHLREVLFAKPNIYIVADHMMPNDNKSHRYEARWHLNTSRSSTNSGLKMVTSNISGSPNLAVVSIPLDDVSVRAISGQSSSRLSDIYGYKVTRSGRVRTTTVAHSITGSGNHVLLTLLLPLDKGESPDISSVSTSGLESLVKFKDGTSMKIFLYDRTAEGMRVEFYNKSGVMDKIIDTRGVSNLPPNEAPSITISDPLDGSSYDFGTNVFVKADAVDPEDEIEKVDFFIDDNLVFSDPSSPYEDSLRNIDEGIHEIVAVVTDAGGATASDTIQIEILHVNQPPVVEITEPLMNSSYFEGTDVIVKANAADPENDLSELELYIDGNLETTDDTDPYEFVLNNLTVGNYSVVVKAIDAEGLSSTDTVSIEIQQISQLISVEITEPLNNSSVELGIDALVKAEVIDTANNFDKFDFFLDGTMFFSATEGPFEDTLSSLGAGSHILVAKVTDIAGAINFDTVSFDVTWINHPPVVQITDPVDNSQISDDVDMIFAVNATDPDDNISTVEFYLDEQLIGSDETIPYSITMNMEAVVQITPGIHELISKVIDEEGASDTDTIGIEIIHVNRIPEVNITSPGNSESIELGNDITIQAEVSDFENDISKVEIYVDDTLKETLIVEPYEWILNENALGIHSIVVIATDGANALAGDTVFVEIIMPNRPPLVNITSPVNNSHVNDDVPLTIKADVSDLDDNLKEVEFYLNSELVGTDNTTPYSITVNQMTPGPQTIICKGIDEKGASSTDTVSIEVDHVNVAPTVSIANPANGLKVDLETDVLVNVDASDLENDISAIEFYLDDTLKATVDAEPYEWVMSGIGLGLHNIVAKVIDGAGASDSDTVQIEVVMPNRPPVVTITAPVNNSQVNDDVLLTIQADASDPDNNISKIEFYVADEIMGFDDTSPYSLTVDLFKAGIQNIVCKVIDDRGATGTDTISIDVNHVNQMPTISISNPINGSQVDAGDIMVQTNIVDPENDVLKVDFYLDDILIGTDIVKPYEYVLSDVAIGSHSILARVTDGEGATASETIQIEVIMPNREPIVNITEPLNNSTIDFGENVEVKATVSDLDNNLDRVEIFLDGKLLGTDETADFSFTLTNLSLGGHSILVKAVDLKGASSSQTVKVTVIDVAVEPPPPGDTTVVQENRKPIITIESPLNNSIINYGNVVTLSVNSSDPDNNLSVIEYYLDGNRVKAKGVISDPDPYKFDFTSLDPGNYQMIAKAIDTKGAFDMDTIWVTINSLPTAIITSPANGNYYQSGTNITVNMNASDEDGYIENVILYNGSSQLGTDNNSPFQIRIENIRAGNYRLKAKAIDNDSGEGSSNEVKIRVVEDTFRIKIINLEDYTYKPTGSSLIVETEIFDPFNAIKKVVFYDNERIIWEDVSRPFTLQMKSFPVGDYYIKAKAISLKGNEMVSNMVHILIYQNIDEAEINIVEPLDHEVLSTNSARIIKTEILDPANNISKMVYYSNGIKIGESKEYPFNIEWVPDQVGQTTLKVNAYSRSNQILSTDEISLEITEDEVQGLLLGFDAYDASVNGVLLKGNDPGANNNTFFHVPPMQGSNMEIPPPAAATFNFRLNKSDDFVIWARVKSSNVKNSDYYIYKGNGEWFSWGVGEAEEWTWKQITLNKKSVQFSFRKGLNSFVMGWKDADVKIDRIYVTDNSDFVPARTEYVTGIDDADLMIEKSMKIFPNPANNIVHAAIQEMTGKDVIVTIQNVNGQKVFDQVKRNVGETIELDVNNLINGFYIVSIVVDDISYHKRLIIAK